MSKYNKDYFEYDSDYREWRCIEHNDEDCKYCLALQEKEIGKPEPRKSNKKTIVNALTLVDPEKSKNLSMGDKEDAIENFNKSVEFVKAALDFTDVGIEKKKVSELPGLLEEAKQKITIGKMKKLYKDEEEKIEEMGVVGKLIFSGKFWIILGVVVVVGFFVIRAL